MPRAENWVRTDKEQRQRQACGAECRDKRQRLVGGAVVDDVQVDCVPRQERRWGAGETEGSYEKKWLMVGGGRIGGGRGYPEKLRQVGQVGIE